LSVGEIGTFEFSEIGTFSVGADTTEIQQFMAKNNSILFSMEAELSLQPDGSFKLKRNIAECMKPSNQTCPQRYQSKILPIEAYR